MSQTDTLQNTLSALMEGGLNRYRLDIPSCASLLDVEDFSGFEAMSQLYHYDIRFTSSDLNIDATQLLSKPATLAMGAGPLTGLAEQKVVHGVVTHFNRISGSRDQAIYQIIIEPFLALLPVMLLPGRTAEGMASLVRLLAPDSRAKIWHHDRRRVPVKKTLTMSVRQPVSLKGRPVMGGYATDANSQVLMRISTTISQEVQGWLPGGELHSDLMALLHVYLGSRLDVRLQLCVDRRLLPDAWMSSTAGADSVQLGRTAVMKPLNAAGAKSDRTITINLGRYEHVQENINRREADEDGNYHW
ncbi:type VI secretion system baseplate subunit TssG [Cronobacter turicensis]